MNDFEKAWVTATLAPESIIRLDHKIENQYGNAVYNENKTIRIYVFSNKKEVFAIGKDTSELFMSPSYTISEAVDKVAEFLNLTHIINK